VNQGPAAVPDLRLLPQVRLLRCDKTPGAAWRPDFCAVRLSVSLRPAKWDFVVNSSRFCERLRAGQGGALPAGFYFTEVVLWPHSSASILSFLDFF